MTPESVQVEDLCGACGRALGTGRDTCLYCGWDASNPTATHGASVLNESRRQGATLWRFLVSSAVFAPMIVDSVQQFARHGHAIDSAVAAVLIGLGPLPLLVQLARRLRGEVVSDSEGLVIGGDRLRWSEFVAIESKGVSVGGDRRVEQTLRGASGLGMGSALCSGGLAGFLLLPVLLIQFFVVPAVLVLSPWCRRLQLRRQRGDLLVLRDLPDHRNLENVARNRVEGPARQVA